MPTRSAAKREAALIQEALAASLSSPPATPANTTDSKTASSLATSTTGTKKRKRTSLNTKKTIEPVVGGWDVLPHGIGKKGDLVKEEDVDEQDTARLSPPPTKNKARRGKPATPESSWASENVDSVASELPHKDLPKKGGRKTKAANEETDGSKDDEDFKDVKPKRKRVARKKNILDMSEEVIDRADELIAASGVTKKERKKKGHKYGLSPGESPFPNHAMPTPEACEEVNRLLSELHGEVKPPEKIPPPSMDVTGCGEVPDLLDAILRTLLSAATTANNSNMALKGLKDKFGLRTSGAGIGSVNWEAVHKADVGVIEQAIKSGGLAAAKSKNIKKILDAVYEQNCARRDALVKEKETGKPANIPGATQGTQKAKDIEISKAEETILSMDHVFEMTTDEAMEEMTKLPGIGVKTASCVILFCMKRPSFAVDTHVWRHCKMLGWVPATATRDQTFSHCEVRVPDHLKYPLHQLFLRHGKTCGRCKAKGSAEEWANTTCPIEHLVTRPGRKGSERKKAAGAKRKRGEEDETDEGDEEMILSDEE